MTQTGLREPTFQDPSFDDGASEAAAIDLHETLFAYDNPEVALRLRTVGETQGFLPTSVGEIHEAFGLMSFIGVPGGAAKHLNEILRHQTSDARKKVNTTDPAAAVRSVTREYAGYAGKARTDRFNLVSLQRDLSLIDPSDNFQTLANTGLSTGLPQFVRYFDLRRLAEDGTVFVNPFAKRSDGRRSALDPYTTPELTDEITRHIAAVLGTTRVWAARQIVDGMVVDQSNRLTFWANRLREAQAHMVAKPIAQEALRHLGIEFKK